MDIIHNLAFGFSHALTWQNLLFCASFAGGHFSVSRNIKIAAGLIAIALVFQKLLGFNLPLY